MDSKALLEGHIGDFGTDFHVLVLHVDLLVQLVLYFLVQLLNFVLSELLAALFLQGFLLEVLQDLQC